VNATLVNTTQESSDFNNKEIFTAPQFSSIASGGAVGTYPRSKFVYLICLLYVYSFRKTRGEGDSHVLERQSIVGRARTAANDREEDFEGTNGQFEKKNSIIIA